MSEEFAIEVSHLTKTFGKKNAVDDISLNVKKGEVFGLLGPNGAGKTTTLRMITTLLKSTSGSVKIFGHDVNEDSRLVRSMFGFTGQYASVDEDISARENLMIFSRLNGLSRSESKQRTNDLLEEFSLVNSADKAISNFSGGMRRRLDLAISLITQPPLIFLDEPTTGLDPRTRNQMWDTIRDLVAKGSTIVLTIQYLEEADELADRVAVIDHGKLIKMGTPAKLKADIGGSALSLTLEKSDQVEEAKSLLKHTLGTDAQVYGEELQAPLEDTNQVVSILNRLKEKNINIANISVKEPSMDDVFFALTVGKN
ncbi:ATP-binding cassette domain-containing protein [Pediococcus argentinicus]|uniref:ATP-binding cassette domain-containing protein n=1 Tax=Pediococcus argentinicus TaxID=480391 RepID=UPI00338EB139